MQHFAQLNLKKKSIDFYNIDIEYLLNSIFTKKVFTGAHATMTEKNVVKPKFNENHPLLQSRVKCKQKKSLTTLYCTGMDATENRPREHSGNVHHQT